MIFWSRYREVFALTSLPFWANTSSIKSLETKIERIKESGLTEEDVRGTQESCSTSRDMRMFIGWMQEQVQKFETY